MTPVVKKTLSVRMAAWAAGIAAIVLVSWLLLRSSPEGEKQRRAGRQQTAEKSPAATASKVDDPKPEKAAALEQRVKEKVELYADIRRQLQSGEMTTLPPEHAPPPVPASTDEP